MITSAYILLLWVSRDSTNLRRLFFFSAVESSQTADDTETWTDVITYRDKSSLYATAPRSKVSIATMPFYSQSKMLHSQPQNRVWLRSRNLICKGDYTRVWFWLSCFVFTDPHQS